MHDASSYTWDFDDISKMSNIPMNFEQGVAYIQKALDDGMSVADITAFYHKNKKLDGVYLAQDAKYEDNELVEVSTKNVRGEDIKCTTQYNDTTTLYSTWCGVRVSHAFYSQPEVTMGADLTITTKQGKIITLNKDDLEGIYNTFKVEGGIAPENNYVILANNGDHSNLAVSRWGFPGNSSTIGFTYVTDEDPTDSTYSVKFKAKFTAKNQAGTIVTVPIESEEIVGTFKYE